MRLITSAPEYFSDICEVVRLFMGPIDIKPDEGEPVLLHARLGDGARFIERFELGGESATHEAEALGGALERKRREKRAIKTACYKLFGKLTGVEPPWGSLTGIRPTRLMYEFLEAGLTTEQAEARLRDEFFVTPSKTALLADIVATQGEAARPPKDAFDVYAGIPFCSTRCAYCSFSSSALGDGALVAPYVRALKREIAGSALITRALRPRAIYVGGGTPTAIPADALREVLSALAEAFPGAGEFTCEAGRPDTIDEEKLSVMRECGVTRLSVNPQTFSAETLRRIGRAHTPEQTVEAYNLARAAGFEDINMDVIAALPGEDEADFARTLDRVLALAPDSVTVHSLAIKRSSALHEAGYSQSAPEAAARMVDSARSLLTGAGYAPYYLYRQKYMAGNLENVGYAREGKLCLYNVDNMEETTPILALGACGITKWVFERERRIERAPNLRNVSEYISRVDEMLERKAKIIKGAQ